MYANLIIDYIFIKKKSRAVQRETLNETIKTGKKITPGLLWILVNAHSVMHNNLKLSNYQEYNKSIILWIFQIKNITTLSLVQPKQRKNRVLMIRLDGRFGVIGLGGFKKIGLSEDGMWQQILRKKYLGNKTFGQVLM
ncbi:hypothetical protein ACJX0J_013953, partial [Zea mays]